MTFLPSTQPKRAICSKNGRTEGSSSSESPAKSTATVGVFAACANARRGAMSPAPRAPSSNLRVAILPISPPFEHELADDVALFQHFMGAPQVGGVYFAEVLRQRGLQR